MTNTAIPENLQGGPLFRFMRETVADKADIGGDSGGGLLLGAVHK